MNPKKNSRRCRASASIQALDLAISRFIYSFAGNILRLHLTNTSTIFSNYINSHKDTCNLLNFFRYIYTFAKMTF